MVMKTFVSGRVLGAIAAAMMVLPFAAFPAGAQTPGGSYLQSCRDVQVRGDRVTATCRTQEGRWNRTSLSNADRCAGGIANSDGRLVCGTRGGGVNVGSERGDRRQGTDYGWRDDGRRNDGWRGGYGGSYNPYGPGYDAWGRWQGGSSYYGR
jgi:hypothetical protein